MAGRRRDGRGRFTGSVTDDPERQRGEVDAWMRSHVGGGRAIPQDATGADVDAWIREANGRGRVTVELPAEVMADAGGGERVPDSERGAGGRSRGPDALEEPADQLPASRVPDVPKPGPMDELLRAYRSGEATGTGLRITI